MVGYVGVLRFWFLIVGILEVMKNDVWIEERGGEDEGEGYRRMRDRKG